SVAGLLMSRLALTGAFFFQAEDGIRERNVTGVQTCALPISSVSRCRIDVSGPASDYTGTEIYYTSIRQRDTDVLTMYDYLWRWEIGRASCRERVQTSGGGGSGE